MAAPHAVWHATATTSRRPVVAPPPASAPPSSVTLGQRFELQLEGRPFVWVELLADTWHVGGGVRGAYRRYSVSGCIVRGDDAAGGAGGDSGGAGGW